MRSLLPIGFSFVPETSRRRQAPIFVQLAAAISEAICAGRMRSGDRLPGTRSLAESLGLHRNTIIAAYDELRAEGWIETERGRGSFVASEMPLRKRRGRPPAKGLSTTTGYSLGSSRRPLRETSVPRDLIQLGGGFPDPRLAPVDLIARAYRRVLRPKRSHLLDYGDARGTARLREAVATMLRAERGLTLSADDVLITRGSQQAISLAAAALVEPGDAVAVESLGYQDAWEAFRTLGAKLIGVPIDGDGLDVKRLRERVEGSPIRAVYVTPHHHYPTLAVLSPARRVELLRMAREFRFAIVEDDYYSEFHWSSHPVLPLAARDRHGSVIYVGTLSKVLAPGLRIGYAVAPRPMLERMTAVRHGRDRQGDHVLETVIADLIEDGELARHCRKMKKVYGLRRQRLERALRSQLDDALEFELPAGGLAIWARLTNGLKAEVVAERALARGVLVTPARAYALDRRSRPFLRIGYAAANEAEIDRGVEILAEVIASLDGGSR